MNNNLFYNSIYNGSGLDGNGIRSVIFFSGCNLRCKYCQNIDVVLKQGTEISPVDLLKKVIRFKPYLKNGGVTLSGGEPFLQAKNLIVFAKLLKENEINIAIQTSGTIVDEQLIMLADSLIVDDKDIDIHQFLSTCDRLNKKITLTKVIIEGENDDKKTVDKLLALKQKYSSIENIKLLPFVNICKSKYEELGLDSSYFSRQNTSQNTIKKLLSNAET